VPLWDKIPPEALKKIMSELLEKQTVNFLGIDFARPDILLPPDPRKFDSIRMEKDAAGVWVAKSPMFVIEPKGGFCAGGADEPLKGKDASFIIIDDLDYLSDELDAIDTELRRRKKK